MSIETICADCGLDVDDLEDGHCGWSVCPYRARERRGEKPPSTDKTVFDCSALVGRHVVHRKISPRLKPGCGWMKETEDRDVVLMALVGAWAMVRRPKCAPYICFASELLPPNAESSNCAR